MFSEEKILLKVLSSIQTDTLAYLDLYQINAGDNTLEYLAKNKKKFKNIVSLNFQVLKPFVIP